MAKDTVETGKDLLRLAGMVSQAVRVPEVVMIPITPLEPEHREAIKLHMLGLDEHDRYLRFGYAATDAHIAHYIESLDFDRDEIYGIFNRNLEIVAMAHLAICRQEGQKPFAEFGVSVSAHARSRGYGGRLFERAMLQARNDKVYQMYIHALSENAPMIRIARKFGADIERDGSETEAYLSLPKRDLDSRVTEILADQYAKTNYVIKEDAKRFWDFLEKVQEIRRGVQSARRQCAE
jgi:RimJ/RimL family protein N-acetyltransferase